MLGIDSQGKSIRRNLTTTFFRELQDITAETLNMQRGRKTQSYTKEQMTAITSAIGDQSTFENKKAYASAFTAQAKKMGIYINKYSSKRKDTHEYKKDKAIENKAITKERAILKPKATKSNKAKRATITQLKKINKELRTQLQNQGAVREDYSILEAEINQLKQQIKNKKLSVEELTTKNKELEHQINKRNDTIEEGEVFMLSQVDTIYELKTKIRKLEKKEPEIIEKEVIKEIEVKKTIYKEDTTRIKELETQINTQKTTIAQNEFKISTLTSNNEALKQKIATLPNPDTLEELNTLKIDFKQLFSKHKNLQNLAFDKNQIVKKINRQGISQNLALSYKELYDKSKQEIKTLEIKIKDKNEINKILVKSFVKLENDIFGDNKNRPPKEIANEVEKMVTVLSNISKYFKTSINKITSLFLNRVPKKEELEKDSFKIESTLSSNTEDGTSISFKPM
jgi:chromosome segregation ATPase